MVDERENNLPKWAQELINRLRAEGQTRTERLTAEIEKLRPQCKLLTNRLAAMDEIMDYLVRGGHPDAAQIKRIVGGFGMNIVNANDEER